MLYGYALGGVPTISIFAFKNTAMSDSSIASAGVVSLWNIVYNSKANGVVQLQGDATYGPIGYGIICDSDWIDSANYDAGGFQ